MFLLVGTALFALIVILMATFMVESERRDIMEENEHIHSHEKKNGPPDDMIDFSGGMYGI